MDVVATSIPCCRGPERRPKGAARQKDVFLSRAPLRCAPAFGREEWGPGAPLSARLKVDALTRTENYLQGNCPE